MTLQDLKSKELENLENLFEDGSVRTLLEDRLNDIKKDDFATRVVDVEGMLKREYNRGMAYAYRAMLELPQAIREEFDLREKERLAQEKKK
jgi:hypothetical protein